MLPFSREGPEHPASTGSLAYFSNQDHTGLQNSGTQPAPQQPCILLVEALPCSATSATSHAERKALLEPQ